jgi:hypothetical protein
MLRTRTLLATFVALVLAVPAFAGESKPVAEKFGAPVTVKKSVPIAKLQKQPEKFTGKVLRIEGVVKNVCQGAGCWVEVEDAKGATFLAKSLDESVLLPNDCKGRRVVVQGTFLSKPAKDHDHAAHAGEAPHECPSPTYLLSTQGIELAAQK